jgi:hypothetical protein
MTKITIDRELLELAAKAAGIEAAWSDGEGLVCRNDAGYRFFWNPLTDDGDAFRLACKLNMRLDLYTGVGAQSGPHPWAYQADYADKAAATRRAIVRAAAEIGRSMT